MKAAILTLGCKVNSYESQGITELLTREGYEIVDFKDVADVYVINTCTVTAVADSKSMKAIRAAHRQNPLARIVVMGCAAQKDAESIAKMPGVSVVIGSSGKNDVVGLLRRAASESAAQNAVSSDIDRSFEEISVTAHESKTRALIKLQDGCENFCSYCIIPFVRGPVRSRSALSARLEARKLAEAGFLEAVITGVHLNSYGRDTGESLLSAIAAVSDEFKHGRVRLGSLDPALCDEEFVRGLASMGNICPHFHLSLQSGDDGVLKRMGRRYSSEKYRETASLFRCYFPGCAITTDIIIGFPGESEDAFTNTINLINGLRLSRVHVFPYSRREGTAAYDMSGQIPKEIIQKRTRTALNAAANLSREYARGLIGMPISVLFETFDGIYSHGHSENYVECKMQGDYRDNGIVKLIAAEESNGTILCREPV